MDVKRLGLLAIIEEAELAHEQARAALAIVEAEASRCRERGVAAHDRVYEECGRWRTQMNVAKGRVTNARHRLERYDVELAREGQGVN